MATLGQQLKAAREAKGVSEHDAGVATKILTKIIAAMEADDFSVMAAPTYAKGFIRLYAEYLGLEPEPLVEEYLRCHASTPASPANQSGSSKKTGVDHPLRLFGKIHPEAWVGVLRQFLSGVWKKIPPVKDIRILAAGVAGLLVLIVLSVSISNCARRHAAEKTAAPQADTVRNLLNEPLPDLYLVEPGQIESAR